MQRSPFLSSKSEQIQNLERVSFQSALWLHQILRSILCLRQTSFITCATSFQLWKWWSIAQKRKRYPWQPFCRLLVSDCVSGQCASTSDPRPCRSRPPRSRKTLLILKDGDRSRFFVKKRTDNLERGGPAEVVWGEDRRGEMGNHRGQKVQALAVATIKLRMMSWWKSWQHCEEEDRAPFQWVCTSWGLTSWELHPRTCRSTWSTSWCLPRQSGCKIESSTVWSLLSIQFFRQDDLSNRVATCCANPRFRSEKRALKSKKETIKTTKALKMSQYAQMTMKVLNSNITSKDFANTWYSASSFRFELERSRIFSTGAPFTSLREIIYA